MAGQTEQDKMIESILEQIKKGLAMFDASYVVKKMQQGYLLWQIAGVDVPEEYQKDLVEAFDKRPYEDFYPPHMLKKDPKTGKPGIPEILGKEGSPARLQIRKAQEKNNPEAFKRRQQEPVNQPSEEEAEEPNDQPNEEEPEESGNEEQKDQDKEDQNKENEEQSSEEAEASTDNPENTADAGAEATEGAEAGGAATEGAAASETVVAEGASAAGGGIAAASAGSTAAAGGAAAAGTVATAGFPIWLALLIISILVVLAIIIVPLIKSSGKEGHVQAQAYENSGDYKVVASLSQEDELKKSLDVSIDQFISRIEEIKKNASGDDKEKITKLCDQILEQAKIIKELAQSGAQMTPEDKGKKEVAKNKILSYIKELTTLLNVKTEVVYLNQGAVEGNMASWGCGYTSLAMIAQSYGIDLKPITIAGDLRSGIPSASWPIERMNSLTKLKWKQASSWEEIVEQINKCNPVAIGTHFSQGNGHWMVLTGFTKSGDAIINDPAGNHGYYYANQQAVKGSNGAASIYNIDDVHKNFDKDPTFANGVIYSAYIIDPPYKLNCNK